MHIFSCRTVIGKQRLYLQPFSVLIEVVCNTMSCFSTLVFIQILSFKGGFLTQKEEMSCELSAEFVLSSETVFMYSVIVVTLLLQVL